MQPQKTAVVATWCYMWDGCMVLDGYLWAGVGIVHLLLISKAVKSLLSTQCNEAIGHWTMDTLASNQSFNGHFLDS